MKSSDFCLEIAAFIIRFYTKEDACIYLPEGYEPFVVVSDKNPDVEIEVVQNLPFNPSEGKDIFKAHELFDGVQPENAVSLWNIVIKDDEKILFTLEPDRNIYPYLAAKFPQNSKKWTIYNTEIVTEIGIHLINPLAYPMGPLLLYHLALYNNAVMIHASGVKVGEEGCIFSGFSGVGKSTMAGLWQNEGCQIINDDRLIVRKCEGKYYFFNTPMYYKDEPKKAPLNAAFLLKHNKENVLTHLNYLQSITKLMAFCIQHHYDPNHVRMIMDTVADIARQVSIYNLDFVPDNSVVQLIKNQMKLTL